MRRNGKPFGIAFALLAIAAVPPALASRPPGPVTTGFKLVDSPGFAASSEVRHASGAVIDTFVSTDSTVRVIGWAGSKVKITKTHDNKSGRSTVTVDMRTSRPKTLEDAGRYKESGRSAVKDLVSLGVDPDFAQREFGDMDVMDPATAAAPVEMASTREYTVDEIRAAATASSTTPYDTQCATVSTGGGEITGQGCSTLFQVAIPKAGDWWFNNKYKFSAHSTEAASIGCIVTHVGCPWRIFELGWSLQWASGGNQVYDWDPSSTINKSKCSSTTISAEYKGFKISYTTDICPDKIQPWNLTGTRSGSEWLGLEQGTAWEATIGLQALHSPPGAPASYSSPFSVQFVHFWS